MGPGFRSRQREAFQKLLQVPFDMDNEDKYKDLEVRASVFGGGGISVWV